jgi:cyclase
LNLRIIPRLDIKGPNLVKGVHLEGLRVLGKPEQYARYYYENGADELFYQDAVASLYGRNSLLDIIERTSREIFIPLTVGGGLRSLEDIRTVLRAGADKVAINTAAIENPDLIREASLAFGSSTIVVSIEAIKQGEGRWEALTNYGRDNTGVDALEWARRAEELGTGELVVTSIDQEGTGQGYDLELTGRIARSVSIPVIALGGAGTLEHIYEVIMGGYADAVSMASVLHYQYASSLKVQDGQFQGEGNIEFLQGKKGSGTPGRITELALQELKSYLTERGIECRKEIAG